MRLLSLLPAGLGLAILFTACDPLRSDGTEDVAAVGDSARAGLPGDTVTRRPSPDLVKTPAPSRADSASAGAAPASPTDSAASRLPGPADSSAPRPVPADTPASKPVPADTPAVKPVPSDTTVSKPAPADAPVVKPAPVETVLVKPGPADTAKPLPADTSKPKPDPAPVDIPVVKPVPVDTPVIKPVPIDTPLVKPAPVDTVKPRPADTLLPKPTTPTLPTPVDTAKPAPMTGGPWLRSDLEDQTAACWGVRGGTGYTSSACGPWSQIGGSGARLATTLGHSGSKSLAVTFSANEEVAGASLPLSADTVHVRAWYYFSEGFDFGQGVKIGRISSFNPATQMNDIDIIMTVRSAGGATQCGLTPMADLGLFFNGRPAGYDWGSITAARPFQRGTWHALEYQVALNRPGRSDGAVKLWVDGTLAAQKTGLNLRGNASAAKLNRLRIGGWYSNSAGGNACAHPSQPSTLHVDDVAVGKAYIGP